MTSLAIVGAGFSGAVTAIEYLRIAKTGDTVYLINRSGEMAQGLAYGTNSPDHLLNVPAGNMSAIADVPGSFVNYCKQIDLQVSEGSFVQRALYGQYLVSILKSAEINSKADCIRIIDEVVEIRHDTTSSVLTFKERQELEVDHVVLAFGNFPPATPTPLATLVNHPNYIADPWKKGPTGCQTDALDILILGCGLTAIDVVSKVKQDFPSSRFTMLSRRGIQPQTHRENLPPSRYSGDLLDNILRGPHTALNYLRLVRRELSISTNDWRDIIASLRPVTPLLWQNLSHCERRRFLRHLQPYWDSYRHRVAPASYRKFTEYQDDGSVFTMKGRVVSTSTTDSKIQVDIRTRGKDEIAERKFDWIINCTGPSTKLSGVDTLLVKGLIQSGTIKQDIHCLGLVTEGTAVVNAAGETLDWLSYIGPMLKATLWEATAVPELRNHALDLASRIKKNN
ncbi:FAD/NAD(P)-binding protein [Pseudomonas syringae]|nr:FAD/NAD(P)-binding protein [Pseudomonas syringae]